MHCSEYFFTQLNELNANLDSLEESSKRIATNPSIEALVTAVLDYFVQLCYAVNCGKTTYLTVPNIDRGHGL